MSLFAQLNSGGIRQPDAVINGSSSLLPTSGAGIQLTTAKINQTSNLLGNISPYDYGPGRVSDDIVYKPVPHKIQKIVPQLTLPGMNETNFKLSHAVDDGDIAFALRTPQNARRDQVTDYSWFTKQHLGRAVDAIVNLPTLNYILAGLQYPPRAHRDQWKNFYASVAVDKDTIKFEDFQHPLKKFHAISCFVRDCVRPIGIVIGSENQGGQHQGNGAGAVDWPTDFVVTILVQGLCDNTANHWRCCEISAGDDLMLALAHTFPSDSDLQSPHLRKDDHSYGEGWKQGNFQKPKANQTYTLNHWRYGTIRQTLNADAEDFKNHGLVELIPASTTEVSKPWLLQAGPNVAEGVWHIARSQVMASSFARHEMAHAPGYRDDTQNLRGGPLIECQVDPLWEFPLFDDFLKRFKKNQNIMYEKLHQVVEKIHEDVSKEGAAWGTWSKLFFDDVETLSTEIKKPSNTLHATHNDILDFISKQSFIYRDDVEKFDHTFQNKDLSFKKDLILKNKFFYSLLFSKKFYDKPGFFNSDFTKTMFDKNELFQESITNEFEKIHSISKEKNNCCYLALFLLTLLRLYSAEGIKKTRDETLSQMIILCEISALYETLYFSRNFSENYFLIIFNLYKSDTTYSQPTYNFQSIKNICECFHEYCSEKQNRILNDPISGNLYKELNVHSHKTLKNKRKDFTFCTQLSDDKITKGVGFPTELAQRASVPLSAGAGAGREKETAGAATKGEAASGDAGDGGRAPKAARKGAVAARRVGGAGGSSGARVLGGVRVVPAGEGEEGE